jgi:hypothetical protein
MTQQPSLFTEPELVKSPMCLRQTGHCGSVGVYYPQATFPFFMITQSTEQARAAFEAKKAAMQQWQENMKQGIPNDRRSL